MGYKRYKIARRTENEDKPLIATALQYDSEEGGAPKVVASGQRKIAEQILAEAKKHNISIYEDPALTAALSTVNLAKKFHLNYTKW